MPIDDMGRYDGGRGTKNPISAIQGVKMAKNCRRLLWMAPMSEMKRTLFFGMLHKVKSELLPLEVRITTFPSLGRGH